MASTPKHDKLPQVDQIIRLRVPLFNEALPAGTDMIVRWVAEQDSEDPYPVVVDQCPTIDGDPGYDGVPLALGEWHEF